MPGVRAAQRPSTVVEIGGMPIRLGCDDPSFIALLVERYAGYVSASDQASFDFEIELAPPGTESGDEDLSVAWNSGRWLIERGDFRAEWNPSTARGRIQQTINPYSLDSVLRIVHTLLLARKGGFLVHASSAIRNGRAFSLSGVSGAGKTTIARLAPPDAALLTDRDFLRHAAERQLFCGGHAVFRRAGPRRGAIAHPSHACTCSPKAPRTKSNLWKAPTPSAGCSETFSFLPGILNL